MNPFNLISTSNDIKFIIYGYFTYNEYNRICVRLNIKINYIKYLDLSIKDQKFIVNIIKDEQKLGLINWFMKYKREEIKCLEYQYPTKKFTALADSGNIKILNIWMTFAQLNFFKFFIKHNIMELIEKKYLQFLNEYEEFKNGKRVIYLKDMQYNIRRFMSGLNGLVYSN